MRTALIVSAALAQIGEFSFILAGLGVNLRLLPAEGLNLIVAGALLSITFNPAVFRSQRSRSLVAKISNGKRRDGYSRAEIAAHLYNAGRQHAS